MPAALPAATPMPRPAAAPLGVGVGAAAAAGRGSGGVRIALAFLAEITVLGVALLGAGAYVRARELDLEERELAFRERAARRD